ncbi:MAG: TraB/GumN family protein [Bacteroidota bacterium]|nr:TraB/GumN family protein [Bacteroidota bacterium]
MKKNIFFLFLMFLSLTTVQAQLLWKVSGNGLKHPSYLFGTHHLISIQFLDSVPGLFKAFNECDMIVGEMVINNIDATAKIQQAAIMPDHKRINDLLNDDEYKLVDKALKSELKLGLKDVSIMNPSLILTLYEMEIYKKLTGFTDDNQSDSYFQMIAAEKGKKVVGLETVDQQIEILFGNGTLKRQADILVEAIRHRNNTLNEIIQLNKLYKAGKIDELVDFSKSKDNVAEMTEEEYAKLVDNRNTDWLKKLPAYFKGSSCFVAVGAMHLGGKNGLVRQLQKVGYKVKAVE